MEFFKLKERDTNIVNELVAGLTTFLAMAYILPVNTGMLSLAGIPVGGVFFATAVAAAVASIVMGLIANLPVALAPGMGLNAFFTFTVVFVYEYSWEAALAAVFISGLLFFIISITGLRKAVINSIPAGLKFAVGAGIGFFITFIGLKNAGIIVGDAATYVALGDLTHPTVLLGLFGILLVIVLYSINVGVIRRFSLILAIFITALVGFVLGLAGVELMPAFDMSSGLSDVWTGAKETVFAAFGGFDELFADGKVFTSISIIITLLFVDFFDTAGTLMAVSNQAGLIDENGEIENGDKALLVDSIGTMTGALLGTSNVTSYIESATGIEQGGRTGLTSITVGVLFLLSILIYPLLSLVNGVFDPATGLVYSPVTAMALVMVGILMVGQLQEIDWKDLSIVIPAFLTIIFMVLSFSIATGIAVGFVFYPIIKVVQGKWREVNYVMYILAALFVLFFIFGA